MDNDIIFDLFKLIAYREFIIMSIHVEINEIPIPFIF